MTNLWTEKETVRRLAARSGNIGLAEELAWRDVLTRHINAGQRSAHLLDIGTGTGWLPILMANRRLKVTGVDSSESLIEIARQRAWEAEQDVKFVVGSAEDLQFPNAAFDAVTMVNALSAFTNPRGVVQAAERVLKPAGRLLIVEDDRGSADYETFLKAVNPPRQTAAPLWNATAEDVTQFLTLNGWQNVQTFQMRGQLDRGGSYRFRPYAVGYTLTVAEKGGSIPL